MSDLNDWEDYVQLAVSGDLLFDSDGNPTALKRAVIAASAGNTTLVAAVSGRHIRIIQLFLTVSLDTTIRLESGTGGTALTGQINLYATGTTLSLSANNGVINLPPNKMGYLETALGTLLNLELSNGNANGFMSYIEY